MHKTNLEQLILLLSYNDKFSTKTQLVNRRIKTMNILYFSNIDFYRKPNPSFHLMTSMMDYLLGQGDTVYYIGREDPSLDIHIPEHLSAHPNFYYRLIKQSPAPRNKFSKRYLEGISYAFKARKFLKEFIPKCDIVFLSSTATILFNALMVNQIKAEQKIVMNIQDMFPGSTIASGKMPRKWMQRIFYFLQKKAYRIPNVIVGISEDMRLKLIEQGVPREKTEVIVNWFDDKSVKEISWEENRFVKKHSMDKDKFYVQYAGTMGFVFDYKMVIEVAKRLLPYKDIVIQMIGMGSQREEFENEVKENKLHNIIFLPLEPQEMVSDVYSACSVCLIPLKHGIIGNSVPSKAGLLMQCKRPIVTSADEDSVYFKEINEYNIGIACSDNNPDKVTEAILHLYNHPTERIEMGKRGYDFGHINYSSSHNLNKYRNLFKKITSTI